MGLAHDVFSVWPVMEAIPTHYVEVLPPGGDHEVPTVSGRERPPAAPKTRVEPGAARRTRSLVSALAA